MKVYSILILLVLFWGGCKERNSGHDAGKFLEGLKNNSISTDYNDVSKNIEKAISEYDNNKVDKVPVIIWAFLLGPYGGKPDHLDVEYYDEEKDAVGIGIKESYFTSDGKEIILVEEYPVLIFRKNPTIAGGISINVKTRDSGQRKSEQVWDDYMKNDKGYEKMDFEKWRSTLPDVWISMPDPNKVDIEMYIYDKEGNKSNSTIVHRKEWVDGKK